VRLVRWIGFIRSAAFRTDKNSFLRASFVHSELLKL
jgi:hypothetical protein